MSQAGSLSSLAYWINYNYPSVIKFSVLAVEKRFFLFYIL